MGANGATPRPPSPRRIRSPPSPLLSQLPYVLLFFDLSLFRPHFAIRLAIDERVGRSCPVRRGVLVAKPDAGIRTHDRWAQTQLPPPSFPPARIRSPPSSYPYVMLSFDAPHSSLPTSPSAYE
ncbi:hypothetical protein C8R44DRAFT_892097 [Mycena epipterygia]|nr:hypothetical protein C8R44DRAFT_892097 [Mycena epipterygia]